jgi:plastocyanin
MRLSKPFVVAMALGLVASACGGGLGTAAGHRSGVGADGGSGPFSCHSESGNPGYDSYGPGRSRRGGLAPERLEPGAIKIDGNPANFHGTKGVSSGQTLEIEMDNDYYSPTVLEGKPGTSLTIDLGNEANRPHTFTIPSQHIDVNCGVRATGQVKVTFPRSGALMFFCWYGKSSGMRGALSAA